MDKNTSSFLWSMTFPSYVENLKKEQRDLVYSSRGLRYPSEVHADYDEKIALVEQLQAMDFYYQEPQTVLDFLKEKKNTLLKSDYVVPPKEDIVGSSAITFFDFLIKAYEEKAKEETESDIFSSEIPQVSPEAFMESAQKGDAPTAEQLGSQFPDQEELGTKEQIIGIEHDDPAPTRTEQAIKQTNTSDADSKKNDSAKGINSREEAEKENMGMSGLSDPTAIPWDTSPTAPDYFQQTDESKLDEPRGKNKIDNPHPVEFQQGYGQTNLLGQFVSGCCNVLRTIFNRPKNEISANDFPRPLSREAFDEKINGLLKTWKFRRDQFDRHWLNMVNDQGAVEELVERIRLNPLMSRAMDSYNNADTENDRQQVSKQLADAMADPHNKFAPELKRDVSALNLGLNKLRQSSRSCVEASLKEPLNRFGCDQAVEKNLSEFFETVLDKPELKLLESEKGENLYEKATRFAHETIEFLKRIKEKIAGLIIDPSARPRNSMSPGT